MAAQYPLKSDPEWLKAAFDHNGLKEIVGRSHNPTIVGFYEDVGHGWVKNDEVAWCAAFVGAMLARSDQPHTGSLAARSYMQWGKKTNSPKRGDIVVLWRGSRNGWQGHVGFYVGEKGNRVYLLGGNQRNAVNVTSYPKSRVLGYRKAVTPANSRTAQAVGVIGVGTTGVGIEAASIVQDTGFHLQSIGSSEWIMLAALVLIVGGSAWALWARYTDWRNKAR